MTKHTNNETSAKSVQLKILTVIGWLFVLALLRTLIQATMYIANNQGNDVYGVAFGLEIDHYRTLVASISILFVFGASYFYNKKRKDV